MFGFFCITHFVNLYFEKLVLVLNSLILLRLDFFNLTILTKHFSLILFVYFYLTSAYNARVAKCPFATFNCRFDYLLDSWLNIFLSKKKWFSHKWLAYTLS